MVWAPGQPLQGGKYIIDRVLGVGGFGITYRAIQNHRRHDQRTVVIKTLKDEVRHDPKLANYQTKLQQDFLNEAVKLAKCHHRHIVEVQEIIREGNLDCIVMEFVEGESLADRLSNFLRRNSTLPEAEALRYIQQVGEALAVVHSRGLLHRDIKPQNIMIRSNTSEAVLIDFGLAREFIQDLTQTHSLALTHGFAPPEQYNPTDKRGAYTDVYALAATLYCLLTGNIPPPAFMRLSGTTLEQPKQLNPNVSDRTNQAILKGLELKMGDRPQSMQDWLSLLEEPRFSPPLTESLPMQSQRPVPHNPIPQSVSRNSIPQATSHNPIPQSLRESSRPSTQLPKQKSTTKSFDWLTYLLLIFSLCTGFGMMLPFAQSTVVWALVLSCLILVWIRALGINFDRAFNWMWAWIVSVAAVIAMACFIAGQPSASVMGIMAIPLAFTIAATHLELNQYTSFGQFHKFGILASTSLAGLGIGWLVALAFIISLE